MYERPTVLYNGYFKTQDGRVLGRKKGYTNTMDSRTNIKITNHNEESVIDALSTYEEPSCQVYL